MKQVAGRFSHDPLSDVQSRFERWRSNRRRGTRIPTCLWRAAAEAAREHGVSKVSQALRLDYYGLKDRVESASEPSGPEPATGRGFLEIPLGAPSAECVLELEDGQGARLRVELKGAAPAELETLARAFWSMAR